MRLLALLPVLLLAAACGDDGVDTSPAPEDPTGLADLDRLAPAIEDAYEQLNYAEYDELIHEDYVFKMDVADVGVFGRQELSAAEDHDSTRSMFAGEYGQVAEVDPITGKPTGIVFPVLPVQSIEMNLEPVNSGSWVEITEGEFAGTRARLFDLDMTVTFAGGTLANQIRGKQTVYVQQGTLRGDTSGTLYWQIRGWQDQGAPSRRDSNFTSLGNLKIKY